MSQKADIMIRRAERAEITTLAGLTRRAYQPWVAVLGREPLPMQADFAAAFDAHRFDVLCEGNVVRALLETELRGDPVHGGSLWIENIAVDPSAQGNGFGGALLMYAEQLAREQGRRRLTLYTNKRMAKNIAIYSARGYVIDKEEVSALGTVVHMSKTLTQTRRP